MNSATATDRVGAVLRHYLEPTGRPTIDGRIRAAQVQAAVRFTLATMLANIANVALTLVALWPHSRDPGLLAWAVVVTLYAVHMIWRWSGFRKRWPMAWTGSNAIVAATVHAGILGTLWGVLPALWFPHLGHDHELLIATLITGMIGAGAFSMSCLPSAASLYVLALTVGSLTGLLRSDVSHLWELMLLLVIYSATIVYAVHGTAKFFQQRTLAEEAVNERGQVIEMLLHEFEENGSDWLYELDGDLNVTSCSPRMCAVTRLREGELVGRYFPDFLGAEDKAEFLQRIAQGSSFHDLTCRVVLDSGSAWWSLTASPIAGQRGSLAGWRGVGSDITEEKRANDHVEWMARVDPLTGLHNRSHFRDLAGSILGNALAGNETIAFACLDLDHFKEVNDTLGHPVGDALLKALAARLKDLCGNGVTMGRLGGDEFGILIEDASSRDIVREMLRRFIAAVSAPVEIDGNTITVGGTIGVALSSDGARTVDDMMRNADLALYAAKGAGRGNIEFYRIEMHRAAEENRALVEDLRSAIDLDQLLLEYQPIIDPAASRVCAFEALLRWDHPTLGRLSPERFIGIAETAGLIGAIGHWVLRKACADATEWPDDVRVAVNVSAAQFAAGAMSESVRSALDAVRLPPRRLELEITEAVFVRREMLAEQFIREMNALGVTVAIDDFGTGYSSLGYLTRFPVQKLKIDRSFISGVRAFRERNAVVAAIVGLARTLDMVTTAEGVETAAELAWVRGLGCNQVQGYFFSRPLAAPDVLTYLAEFRSTERLRRPVAIGGN